MKKSVSGLLFALCLVFGTVSESFASYCNSPCPNPCAPSKTICEGTNCTTYCNVGTYTTSSYYYYTAPGVSFTYSTPGISFSISNAFRPVYHYKNPPRPIQNHNIKPAHNVRPAMKPASKPMPNHAKGPKRA